MSHPGICDLRRLNHKHLELFQSFELFQSNICNLRLPKVEVMKLFQPFEVF